MFKKIYSERILAAIDAGNHRLVFDLLYESCWPKILKYVRKNNGGKAEAEDVFHDALIIFLKQLKLGRFQKDQDPDGYVFVIARNLWINHVKRERKQETIDHFNFLSDEDIHYSLVSKEWEERVMNLMGVLGERCKQLLSLTIFHNYKMIEVMEEMRFGSVDVAKTKHYKCKQRLIEAVKTDDDLKNYLRNG